MLKWSKHICNINMIFILVLCIALCTIMNKEVIIQKNKKKNRESMLIYFPGWNNNLLMKFYLQCAFLSELTSACNQNAV